MKQSRCKKIQLLMKKRSMIPNMITLKRSKFNLNQTKAIMMMKRSKMMRKTIAINTTNDDNDFNYL